ncbi:MAG: SprT-like domain-containing protein [Nitrospirae bacterium]|nr:SprT-like domain-containing protein [Nitrospirota bacterium]
MMNMIVIKTNNEQYKEFLEKYAPDIEYIMRGLARHYKFRPPKNIIFRPMRKIGSQHFIRCVWANAGWSHGAGYYISLDMESNMPLSRSRILDTIAHEAAHIAEVLTTNECTHGKRWQELYGTAKEILKAQ